MTHYVQWLIVLFAVFVTSFGHADSSGPPDSAKDILVTFVDSRSASRRGGVGAPYRNRKRYAVGSAAKRDADSVADDYSLTEVDSWPIRSLSVYCVVYRAAEDTGRPALVELLRNDPRVESAQLLNEFETESRDDEGYDDPHVNLQHGLKTMSVAAAHTRSRGRGVRIVIVDSSADARHEDLRGRVRRVTDFTGNKDAADMHHGTAVASVIGARSNNAKGIVGIAPEARLEVFAACWQGGELNSAVCNSFTLAKALDKVASDPPDIVNLSLAGPADPLLERLLRSLHEAGVILVAAGADNAAVTETPFPASLDIVIGVSSSGEMTDSTTASKSLELYAPGDQVLVATPEDSYDFRSGSSIASAHATGVIALMLAEYPQLTDHSVREALRKSQLENLGGPLSINACTALAEIDGRQGCP